MTRAQTAVIVGGTAPPPKPPKDVRKAISKQAALAVLGGRFTGGVLEAIEHPDFAGASEYYTREHVKQLSLHPESVATAKSAERVRMQCALAGQLSDVLQYRDDPDYLEARTSELVGLAQAGALMTDSELQEWSTLFEKVDAAEKKRRQRAAARRTHLAHSNRPTLSTFKN